MDEFETEESQFSEGLPDEYLPRDLNLFSNRDKLEADLKFRHEKLETSLREEATAFEKNFDIKGKDKEAFEKLLDDHQAAREEFKTGVQQTLQNFREAEEISPAARGLR